MFKSLLDLARQVLFLARDMDETKARVTALQEEVRKLSDVVKLLAFDLERLRGHGQSEREKLELRLENILLRFERRLPPPAPRADED